MATAVARAGSDELIIDSPFSASLRVQLGGEKYTLGRSSANDIAFPEDPKLSREHLVFEWIGNNWTVRDVGSRNGTHLNGARVTGTMQLSPSDLIGAGHLSIRFRKRVDIVGATRDEITFFEDERELPPPTESLDLKSALKTASDLSGRNQGKNEYLEALVRAARELAGHGALEKLFEVILELSLDAANATRGVVITRQTEGSLRIRAIRGEGLRISTRVRDLVLNEGKSVLIGDTRLDQDLGSRESILAQKVRSILAVPLQTDETILGLLYLDSPHLVREFSAEDLKLVTVMANIAAIRIDHARLMEQEHTRKLLMGDLERAAEIQRQLLPAAAPEIAGFDVAAYNLPCRTVGGDYYDFLANPNGRLTVLIGDVSGKGLGAALLMSNLQARAHVIFESVEP
ncbi:MAG: FHA domain-containing protein, partial [Bryobacteraceae bacterium]